MAFLLKSDDELLEEINDKFRKYLRSGGPELVNSAAEKLCEDLITDAIMNVIFECDIERKTGIKKIIEGTFEEEEFKIQEGDGVDIFGQTSNKKTCECTCPCCQRTMVGSRFAPHLEKCLGMGRISSRIANKRITSNLSKDAYSGGEFGADEEEDMDDDEWTVCSDKRGKRKEKKSSNQKSVKN